MTLLDAISRLISVGDTNKLSSMCVGHCQEIRRCIAIAQAVEEQATDEIIVEVKRQIMRRADELLKDGK